MSAPPTDQSATLSTSGYEDGLGRRTLAFDREYGVMLEWLCLRPELAAFEQALRTRTSRLSAFEDERFARVRGIERDRDTGHLTVISEFVAGSRLCDALDCPADENAPPSVDVALGFLLEALPALGSLHATGIVHGAVGPGRIVLTPLGQIVLTDDLFGAALERLQFSPYRLWKEFGIAMAVGTGAAKFDIPADIAQAVLCAVALIIGRPLREDEYPHGLPSLLMEVVEIAQLRGSASFAASLQRFLQRTLPMPGQRPYPATDDAVRDLQRLVRGEMGTDRCRAALTDFITDIGRASASAATPAAPPVPASLAGASGNVRSHSSPPSTVNKPIDYVASAVPSAISQRPSAIEIVPPTASSPTVPEPPAQAVAPPARPAVPAIAEITATILRATAPAVPEVTGDAPLEASAEGRQEDRHEEPAGTALQTTQPEGPVTSANQPSASANAQTAESEPPAQPETIPEPQTIAEPPSLRAGNSRRKRARSPKAKRDKLRSISAPRVVVVTPAPPPVPVPVPAPVPVAVPAPVAVRIAPPLVARQSPIETIWEAPVESEPLPVAYRLPPPAPPAPPPVIYRPPAETQTRWQPPVTPSLAASVSSVPVPQQAAPTGVIRLKTAPPPAYVPVRSQPVREHDADRAFVDRNRGRDEAPSKFPWKLAAAAMLMMVVGVSVGRAYMFDRESPKPGTPSAAPERVEAPAAPATGSLSVTTQPPGARVLLDGKYAGQTPLTIPAVTRGRHVVTFTTSGGAVKRVVRVEAGKTLSIDVPVFSGWVAIYAPIVLEVSENGHSIGTTEQGHLMLPPGDHTLTLANRDLGYSAQRTVTIEAGEERSITIEPRGALNLNAVPWAEVWIDGQKAGETPIANLQVGLGTREIIFRHPQFPERKMTATVTATAAAAISIDFNKPARF